MSNQMPNWIKSVIIAGVILILLCLWFLRNIAVERIIEEQHITITNTIQKTIKKQAEMDLFIPDIQFIQLDSKEKVALKNSIISRTVKILAQKYDNPDSLLDSKISISPFFLFPEYPDKNGKYMFTKLQLDKLRNHIYYLAKQVDAAVTSVKAEVNNDIARLNLWLTLWVGILAIFGAIFPLFYNYKINDDLKQTKTLSEKASVSATEAIKKYKEAEPEIKKIDGVKENIETTLTEIPKIKKAAKDAKMKSELALETSQKTESLLFLTSSIQKLNSLDGKVLMHSKDKKATLVSMLKEIKNNLSNSGGFSGNGLMLDLIRNLSLRIHSISLYTFIGNKEIVAMNNFSIFLKDKLDSLSDDGFPEIVDKMEELILNLEG